MPRIHAPYSTLGLLMLGYGDPSMLAPPAGCSVPGGTVPSRRARLRAERMRKLLQAMGYPLK